MRGYRSHSVWSLLVLFLLALFVWYGSGPLSLEARGQPSREERVPDATPLRVGSLRH